MSAAPDPLIGAQLAGYRIEALVGRGGMGSVYRAEDPGLGRKVAIKALAPDLATDETFRERFLSESRLAASIEHPNILPIHEAGEENGVLYIVMRYVDGVDLRKLLEQEGPLESGRALAILGPIAAALDAAHARGLIHRDIKPANIFVAGAEASAGEHAYLGDFGLSTAPSLRRLTRPEQLIGTVQYIAPEQIKGTTVDRRADVYALGAVLYEALSARAPFVRENEAATLWAHLQDDPPSVVAERDDLPAEIDTVVQRAMAKDPASRYPTAGGLVDAARAALSLDAAERGRLLAPVRDDRLDHFATVAEALFEGRLVPVLGPAANVCGRPRAKSAQRDPRRLPDANEIAGYLAQHFDYPPKDHRALTRVAQYVATVRGSGPLYDELHHIFDADFQPTSAHRFLAELPARLRAQSAPNPLLVTTNYDEALEHALAEAGEDFDVVSYLALGNNRGKFVHRAPDGKRTVIDLPNTYLAELSLERRPVILKVHGQVDRVAGRSWESFVVTEDDHLDYLVRGDVAGQIPVALSANLRNSHFLFLGCSLRDWDFRVLLNRMWGDRTLAYRSWAVQPDPDPVEREFWRERGIDVLDTPLDSYVDELRRAVLEHKHGDPGDE